MSERKEPYITAADAPDHRPVLTDPDGAQWRLLAVQYVLESVETGRKVAMSDREYGELRPAAAAEQAEKWLPKSRNRWDRENERNDAGWARGREQDHRRAEGSTD